MVTIYALRCLVNKKAYIGCTEAKLSKRLREHRCLLNNNKHNEKLLQNDWNEYGSSHFEIVALEMFSNSSVEHKRKSETAWMAKFDTDGLLYNTNRASFMPCEQAIRNGVANSHKNKGNRWTAEANEKRRLAQLGKPKNHGHKISATKKALGQRPTIEAAIKGNLAMQAKRRLS